MEIAFTIQRGISDGEYLREMNPAYQEKRKEIEKKIVEARGSS